MSKKPLLQAAMIKLLIPAGKAAPAPPVGPALGQKGIKAIDFCKAFNDQTKHYIPGVPIRTRIHVNPDRTYKFVTKNPPSTWLLKQAAGLEKGTDKPGQNIVGQLSLKHIYEIALVKQPDFGKNVELEAVCRSLLGSARCCGIEIVP